MDAYCGRDFNSERPSFDGAQGLGRVKTLPRHDGVELRSHWPSVRPPRARLASSS